MRGARRIGTRGATKLARATPALLVLWLLIACGTATPSPATATPAPSTATARPAAPSAVAATAAAPSPVTTTIATAPVPAATPVAATPVAGSPVATPSGPVQAAFGTSFKLRVGQVALFPPDDGLEVRFLRVVEDSRCPKNVTCVWSGQLIIEVAVARAAQPLATLLLNTINATRDKDKPLVQNYNLALLGATPVPEYPLPGSGSATATPIAPEAYVAELLVTELSGGIAFADRAALGQRVQVRRDQVATFATEGLTLRFADVVGESRCPNSSFVSCATAGTATVRLQATLGPTTRDLTLTLPGLTDDTTRIAPGPVLEATRATFEGYRIQLVSLEPQPDRAGKPAPQSYTIILLVTRP